MREKIQKDAADATIKEKLAALAKEALHDDQVDHKVQVKPLTKLV